MVALSSFGRLLPLSIRSGFINLYDTGRERFLCPLCGYFGPFLHLRTDVVRQHVLCARCGSMERHRLTWLVFQALAKNRDLSRSRVLHFAPERCLTNRIASMAGHYETADISGRKVDHRADMCDLPFPDESFDVVLASHVLHHVHDETRALRSLSRVLRPGGMAILPTPIFSEKTVEFEEPVETQMRAPGLDFFDRCEKVFHTVQLYSSTDFAPQYQVWVYEDRSKWAPHLSLRPCSQGERHKEYVPICFR